MTRKDCQLGQLTKEKNMDLFFEVIIAFLLKMADNALSTVKTVFLTKGKYLLASIFAGISTLFYLLAIVRIASTNNIWSILAMCFATFLGTLLPCFIIKKSERDKLYIFDITSDTFENGKMFADVLRTKNVAVNTSVVYDRNLNRTLLCKVYCASKEQSKMVQELLRDKAEFKYNVYVPIEE